MTPNAPRPAFVLLAGLLLAATACTTAPPARDDGGAEALPAVQRLTAPPSDWSALVGQRVRVDVPLSLSGNHALAREGELLASFGGRLRVPTEDHLPGVAANAAAAENARRRLRLVVARGAAPAAEHRASATLWRNGSLLAGVEGLVASDRDGVLLRVDRPLRVDAAPRPPPPAVAGDVRVASLNLENLFNGDGRGGGFPTSRGARTHAEYLRQRGKLVASLRALDADVVALMELENDGEGPESSLAQLVAALDDGRGDWRHASTCAGPCPDPADAALPIRVGLIYRASRVAPVGPAQALHGAPFGERSRVPLAQAFRAGNGPVFTVVAVHLKSKGCSDAQGPDRDQGDGQACWNATRLDSARRLDDWLTRNIDKFGQLMAIVGDFNAYGMEDPVRFMLSRGWRDAFAGVAAPYSYVYAGEAGRLDHALLSPALAARLAGAAAWHSNADEAPSVGYHPEAGDGSPATPWRSSDHDPLLLGFRLRAP